MTLGARSKGLESRILPNGGGGGGGGGGVVSRASLLF